MGTDPVPGASPSGLFAPESPIRRVHREGVLLLGGGRALLLQLAHPLVAAGVAEHSGFKSDPFDRLRRTLDATLAIVFADRATALDAAERVRRVHARVHGHLREPAGPFPAGTPYNALDPELLLWVHATLIDTALDLYERFVGRLDPDARVRYYDETRAVARLFGIPDARIPGTLDAFRAYVGEMLASEALTVTPTARDLAAAVLHPPVPLVPNLAGRAATFFTVALLPPRFREAYGLAWGRRREAAWRALVRAGRLTLPALPRPLRDFPQARRHASGHGSAPASRGASGARRPR
jgi:uncharacterized protein (DUF2236 family)